MVLVRVGRPLARLEGNKEVGPTGRSTQLVSVDEVTTEDIRQQLFELRVDAYAQAISGVKQCSVETSAAYIGIWVVRR